MLARALMLVLAASFSVPVSVGIGWGSQYAMVRPWIPSGWDAHVYYRPELPWFGWREAQPMMFGTPYTVRVPLHYVSTEVLVVARGPTGTLTSRLELPPSSLLLVLLAVLVVVGFALIYIIAPDRITASLSMASSSLASLTPLKLAPQLTLWGALEPLLPQGLEFLSLALLLLIALPPLLSGISRRATAPSLIALIVPCLYVYAASSPVAIPGPALLGPAVLTAIAFRWHR